MGTAAYKTVELDDLLGCGAPQYRETQSFESQTFLSLFPNGRKIMKGGVASGFNILKLDEFRPCLYQISGNTRIHINEVPLKCSSLNNSDAFVLDLGKICYSWVGKKATKIEKFISGIMLDELRGSRKNTTVERLELDGCDEFWKSLGGKQEIKQADQKEDQMEVLGKVKHVLYQLSDESGQLQFTKVFEGKVSLKMLKSKDVFILDVGNHIFCWIGKGTTDNEKKHAMVYAQDYIGMFKKPIWIPIIKVLEGKEGDFFHSLVDE